MTAVPRTILGHIRSLAADGDGDPALLERFVRQRDEAAFAALVERHGPMVLGVCHRVLRDGHAAEDAFQATFLVLARRAAAIRQRGSVGSWLHGVALRLARKARSRALRPDPRPAGESADPLDDLTWREVRQILDDELRRLPERYRLPLVLCYLEGRTRDEAAAQLGWSAQRVKGQLERGREHLRKRLLRRGVAPAAAVSAALLTEPAKASVPPLLAVAVVPAALKYGSGNPACGAPAAVVALANEGVRAMTSHVWKVAAAVVLLAGVAAVGARAVPGDKPAPATPAAQPTPPAEKLALSTVPRIKATFLRRQDGKPPMRAYHVKLELTNPSDKPIWLLFRYYADWPLTASGKFTSEAYDGGPQCFDGEFFDGDKSGGRGKAIEITYIGRTGFHAFHLPPRAAVTFDDYRVEAFADIMSLEVWAVSALRVNGRTPLQDWVPYPTLSDQQARIPAGTRPGNLDWDEKTQKSRTDYPKEKVTSVEATVVWRLGIDIAGLAKPWGPTTREWRDGPKMTLADVGAGKLVFSPDGKTLLSSAKYPGKVQRWDTATGQELPLTKQDQATRYSLLGFGRDGTPLGYRMLYGPADRDPNSGLEVVNLLTGERRGRVEFHDHEPNVRRHRHVELSQDEQLLAVSEWDAWVIVFEAASGRRLGALQGSYGRPVQAMAFSPDNKSLAVSYAANEPIPGRKRNEVVVWDMANCRQRWQAATPTPAASLAFSPDSKFLAAGQDAGEVPVWYAATGNEVARLKTHPDARRLQNVAFDGTSLAASWQAGDSAGVAFWDSKTWKEQVVLYGKRPDVWAVALSADGKQLAFADIAKGLHIKQALWLRYRER